MARNRRKAMKPIFFDLQTEADLFTFAESKENFSEWVKTKLKGEIFIEALQESIEQERQKEKIIWRFPENKRRENND